VVAKALLIGQAKAAADDAGKAAEPQKDDLRRRAPDARYRPPT
jgi:hypothetical protein